MHVEVTYRGGALFAVEVGEHHLTVDQPVSAGGQDLGPTPAALLLGAVAADVATRAERYLRGQHLPACGLRVEGDRAGGGSPGAIQLRLLVPTALSARQRQELHDLLTRGAHAGAAAGMDVQLSVIADRLVGV